MISTFLTKNRLLVAVLFGWLCCGIGLSSCDDNANQATDEQVVYLTNSTQRDLTFGIVATGVVQDDALTVASGETGKLTGEFPVLIYLHSQTAYSGSIKLYYLTGAGRRQDIGEVNSTEGVPQSPAWRISANNGSVVAEE